MAGRKRFVSCVTALFLMFSFFTSCDRAKQRGGSSEKGFFTSRVLNFKYAHRKETSSLTAYFRKLSFNADDIRDFLQVTPELAELIVGLAEELKGIKDLSKRRDFLAEGKKKIDEFLKNRALDPNTFMTRSKKIIYVFTAFRLIGYDPAFYEARFREFARGFKGDRKRARSEFKSFTERWAAEVLNSASDSEVLLVERYFPQLKKILAKYDGNRAILPNVTGGGK